MASNSQFRVEKQRSDAVVTLSSGRSIRGVFFIAGGSARHAGPERVGDLLNTETGFFPFEIHDADQVQTVLFNRDHVVMVRLEGPADHEAQLDPGYEAATGRVVSALLSTGERITGSVRVYRPPGRDRLSDWARDSELFRYLETDHGTLIVNASHIVEVSEV